jgi:hypothetical protein
MTNPQKPAGHGCLFWGGIIAGILLVLALLAGYATYRYARHVVYQYTDTKPLEMPVAHLSDEEVTNLQQRVDNFDKALRKDKPVEPLVLTADEINAMIENANKTNPHPVRLYFSFNDDRVQAKLSVPTDNFGVRMLKGRYFNGKGDFVVSLHDGRLMLHVKSLWVKDRPLPEQFMQSMRQQNFADSWTNDVELNKSLAKLREIKIEGGKLFVIPKMAETNSVAEPASGK